MICPNDGSELRMSERQGVEIDYCPQCRGVWLDRGELDKILERNEDYERSSRPEEHRRREEQRPHEDHRRPSKKRKNLLNELFEF